MEENLKKEQGSERGMERRRRVVVRGEVQDVGFRLFLYENASAMDISEFYARNIPEGVEVLVGGPDAEKFVAFVRDARFERCLLYTSPSPRDGLLSRMPSSA